MAAGLIELGCLGIWVLGYFSPPPSRAQTDEILCANGGSSHAEEGVE